MTDEQWKELGEKYRSGEVSEGYLINETEDEAEHPEDWEYPCGCRLCMSYAD